MAEFTHFNKDGRATMVDVTEKADTKRVAVAKARVFLNEETYMKIKEGGMKKGDVLGTAQIAGVMAAKETSRVIPMCHPIFINGVDISFEMLGILPVMLPGTSLEGEGEEASIELEEKYVIEIEGKVKCTGPTGVEMEALTAVSVAALTIYDMCKAVQKDIIISDIHLVTKSGGKSGDYSYN